MGSRRFFLFAFLLLCAALGTALLVSAQAGPGPARSSAQPARDVTIKYVPDDVQETSWLKRLAAEQAKAIAGVSAFHNFQFTDRVAASGITFKHRIVDDAGKTYKAAHYDHGNGIAMADVDGDGLIDIYFVSQVGGNHLWKNLGG